VAVRIQRFPFGEQFSFTPFGVLWVLLAVVVLALIAYRKVVSLQEGRDPASGQPRGGQPPGRHRAQAGVDRQVGQAGDRSRRRLRGTTGGLHLPRLAHHASQWSLSPMMIVDADTFWGSLGLGFRPLWGFGRLNPIGAGYLRQDDVQGFSV
jgi:hypothetical protein